MFIKVIGEKNVYFTPVTNIAGYTHKKEYPGKYFVCFKDPLHVEGSDSAIRIVPLDAERFNLFQEELRRYQEEIKNQAFLKAFEQELGNGK